MKRLTTLIFHSLAILACLIAPAAAGAADADFHRAINLNGPALTIDGHPWEASAQAKDFKAAGKSFENQTVPLRPTTDTARSRMIRSSIWGDKVDLELRNVPTGVYQLVLYVWEDNQNERFNILINNKVVVETFESGTAGMWKRLGPFGASPVNGLLTISARAASHGAANLSGLEIWKGDGPIPYTGPQFANNPTPEQLDFFEKRIRPILADNCYECHSASSKKLKGSLLLDSRAGIRKGGETGPAITPGDPDASMLIQAVRHANEDLAMPPKKKLAASAIADLEAWVKMGAPDPRATDTVAATKAKSAIDWPAAKQWWSFQPLIAPTIPAIENRKSKIENPIDAFILAKADSLSPPADRRTLLRRASFDLIGLPPTPAEVDAFLADTTPDAFAKVVDRLLASPQYGERWGRHWLDVVRYADTAGDNSDFPIPQMHRYRDWVINAFNRDLPYDQFIKDQLAGDLIGGRDEAERQARIIATGYIANSRRFGSRVEDYPQHLTIEDTIDNVGRAFLGLTVNCARCHDHKFDPITSEDYYALYGIFHSTRYPWPGIELEQSQRDLVPLVPPSKLADAEAAKKKREDEQRRLDKLAQTLKDSLKNTPDADKKTVQDKIKETEKAAADFRNQPPPFELAYAVADAKKIEDAILQQKGDPARPGPLVHRHFLTILGRAPLPADDRSSGRLALANWITSPDNPLTPRVIANRIWQHHFGRGIVPTPNDFGKQGKPPTHPELLDYLASQLRDNGWSIKHLHRLIMLSRTYQQSSSSSPAIPVEGRGEGQSSIENRKSRIENATTHSQLPASNYCVFPRLRLDAESLRDSLLFLGGNLDLSPAGPHPFPPQSDWKFTQHNPFKAVYDTNHRSVYLMTQRIQRHPFLAVFDGADPSASTSARPTSTTPLQSLFLLNDPLIHRQSTLIAGRLIAQPGNDDARITRAYQLLFSRPPDADDLAAATNFLAAARARLSATGLDHTQLDREAWSSYIRVLLRLNEFVYIE